MSDNLNEANKVELDEFGIPEGTVIYYTPINPVINNKTHSSISNKNKDLKWDKDRRCYLPDDYGGFPSHW